MPTSSSSSAVLPPTTIDAGELLGRLRLETSSSEPYYLQLQRQIEALVKSGALPAGSNLPSERDLAEALQVSRATVKRSYDGLRQAQVLRSRGRRGGTAVHSAPQVSPVLQQLKGFTDEMRELGLVPSTRVLAREVVRDAAVAARFGRRADAPFLRLLRLRLADGSPMSRETAWYDLRAAPALAQWPGDGSAYAYLREHCGLHLTWADQSIEAVVSSPEETAAFGFAQPQPCLLLKRLSYTADDRPVEYAQGCFRGDAYRYRLRLQT
ncbi:GntR family transcriptional regulator [Xenophilus sp. Marseille-Q4582]|uniref:GntR family transcriptional regulator n=1 Tax=Xenophilus sp. Marseille-Q4582 TaxID=2866600 RepID=UPI001CE46801|nr:GntR family transcriptional regulator [Xenophilus sp. Marseille-Q4582]